MTGSISAQAKRSSETMDQPDYQETLGTYFSNFSFHITATPLNTPTETVCKLIGQSPPCKRLLTHTLMAAFCAPSMPSMVMRAYRWWWWWSRISPQHRQVDNYNSTARWSSLCAHLHTVTVSHRLRKHEREKEPSGIQSFLAVAGMQ